MPFGIETLVTLAGPLLGKAIALLAIFAGVLSAFLYAKSKGASQERQKQEAAKVEIQKHVTVAVAGDAQVDAKVKEKIEAIKDAVPQPKAADSFNIGDHFKL